MSIALDQTLQDVELESGRTYRCRVGNVYVEVRVLPADPLDLTADTMLDPWIDLPLPHPSKPTQATRGVLPPPDIPEIPSGVESI